MAVNLAFYQRPLFNIGGHYVSTLGLIVFDALFAFGIVLAHFLQSNWVRHLVSRFKLDTNFIAIVTTILSLALLVFLTVTAVNAAGLPLAWSAPLPGIKLSLVKIFPPILMLVTVFWLSSRTNRFVPNKKFIEGTVTNWTCGDARVHFRIPIGVAYGSGVEKVRAALTAAGREHPNASPDPGRSEIPNPQREIFIRSGSIAVTSGRARSETTPGASVQA
ncbi:MAG: mechanosensitive ion channel [Chthoniobacterales bacterium]|nr:mechanosensitive ion channel [Chthoniobacterales bacterium]